MRYRKCSATMSAWFSIYFENAFVKVGSAPHTNTFGLSDTEYAVRVRRRCRAPKIRT